METIDLITLRARRELSSFTRETKQPTKLELLDLDTLRQFNSIEIDEEHVTIKYNEKIERKYNANEITHREWVVQIQRRPRIRRRDPQRHRAGAQAPARPAG